MRVEASPLARGRADVPLSAWQLARVCELVEAHSGLDFREARRSLLESSLRARMRHLDIPALEGYVARLSAPEGAEECDVLVNALTITETQFLRDPAQFALLTRHILPTLMAERGTDPDRRLRICSAGCASGEEPYSLAISWRETEPALPRDGWTVEIVGIDVNREMLELARRRLYARRSLRNLDPGWIRRYFTQAEGAFELDAGLAAAVRFERGSLLDEGTLGSERYDVVVCKNVSIYFSGETTRRLVERLHAALTPGGYLLLGHSESLWQRENGLELIEHEGVFCYRKAAAARVAAPAANVRNPGADADAYQRRYAACLDWVRNADWPRAEDEVASLIASGDGLVPAELLMAGIHAHLGRYAEASDCAERVLRLNSLEPKAHLLLGMIAARSGRSDDAIAALRRALDLDGSLALGYFWLGNLYRDRGHIERACAEYARAVTRHDHRELDFTEEFAADLRPAQIVDFCRNSLERLRGTW